MAALSSAGADPTAAADVTCDGKAATVVVPVPGRGTYPVPAVTSTPGDDVIGGAPQNDSIDRAGGNDQESWLGHRGRDYA